MNICVLSNDLRYKELGRILSQGGYNLVEGTKEGLQNCDALVLSVANEYNEEELVKIRDLLNPYCVVFSGNAKKVSQLLLREVIDYSKDLAFLQKNAELTAEACLSLIYGETKRSLRGERVLVSGYGKIGKELCRILDFLGAELFVYARRAEIRSKVESLGYKSVDLNKLPPIDIVLNTVPHIIFTKAITDSIPNTVLFELASKPGGYEDLNRVVDGGRLPGRILYKTAAKIIYNTLTAYFPCEKGHI